MLAFFTSDFSPRYKEDALLSLVYPAEHIMVLRYRQGLVDPELRRWKVRGDGHVRVPPLFDRAGVLIYAETTGQKFSFYPFRFVRLLRSWTRGEVYFFAIALKSYVHYGTENIVAQLHELRETIESLPLAPGPSLPKDPQPLPEHNQSTSAPAQVVHSPAPGCYVSNLPAATRSIFDQRRPHNDEDLAWQSVVHAAQQSPDLQKQLFYRVRGLHRLTKRRLTILGAHTERLIRPRSLVAESIYPLPVGDLVVMKIDSYRPSHTTPFAPVRLRVAAYGDKLVGVGPQEFDIHSRYNEERIVLACKRVLEDSLAPIAVRVASDVQPSPSIVHPQATQATNPAGLQQMQVTESLLLTQVTVSKWVVALIIAGLIIVPLLIGANADSVTGLGRILAENYPTLGKTLSEPDIAQGVTTLFKWVGASLTLLIGYVAYRKIPLGK